MSFIKERVHPSPGSIPHALDMFAREGRFYREVAPHIDVRVPDCYEAYDGMAGCRLELEDLSEWTEGADPEAAARVLRKLHDHVDAERRWPWLRRSHVAAAPIIGDLYDNTWPDVARRADATFVLQQAGERLVGRIAQLEVAEERAVRPTLIHGDASLANMRTSPTGEIALLDWEDVRIADGTVDLAWLLLTSVEPDQWDAVIDTYGATPAELADALPAAIGQSILSLADEPDGSPAAASRIRRIERAEFVERTVG